MRLKLTWRQIEDEVKAVAESQTMKDILLFSYLLAHLLTRINIAGPGCVRVDKLSSAPAQP